MMEPLMRRLVASPQKREHQGLSIISRQAHPKEPVVLVTLPSNSLVMALEDEYGGLYPHTEFRGTHKGDPVWVVRGADALRLMRDLRPYVWGRYIGYIDSWKGWVG